MREQTHGDRLYSPPVENERYIFTGTEWVRDTEPRWHDLDFRVRGAIIFSGIAFVAIVLTVAILVVGKLTS